MKTQQELKAQLRQIDRKGYKAYKILEGEYDFGTYRLCIDHVQGDPFATPSRVRIVYRNRGNINSQYFEEKHRRIAVEDYLLRRLHQNLKGDKNMKHLNNKTEYRQAKGSGKSGLVTTCRTGQEILERTAMRITENMIEARIEVGFPAFGRTIAAEELSQILFFQLPDLAEKTFHIQPKMQKELDETIKLADDQQYIREELTRRNLVAFVADGSILPRESGVSQRPMKNAVVFKSPDSLSIVLELPHHKKMRGMGIPAGITVIVGGGFHGKSTLLKALERGIYNHIAGDGREFVITDESAFKLRAEEQRCIHETDISMFISNLPIHSDTTRFSTENASGSTSQAANTIEALAADSKVLLIDEDTSATNFMIRDGRMAQLVSDEKEPITPFIRKIRSLYCELGISTILVAGSSGDYLSVADTVLQMDCYETKDVTEHAKQLTIPLIEEKVKKTTWLKWSVHTKKIEKVRVHGCDSLLLDKNEIDLRYLEQIVDESQIAALAYIMQYILGQLADGKKTALYLAEEAAHKLEKEGILSMTPKNYGAGAASAVRKQEILACLTRYRL
ncbi:MAG: ABC-ATPase domain-containing protein [Lachnospiraceae bacterium]|jgi:predicted ABC-class ATPase|nr:ABC-ATPase domain-containing protein [Lachnospiraceae bacterium]